MASAVATMTSKGQVTIPKAVREALGIEKQDQLLFIVEGDELRVVPLRRRDLSDLFGALASDRPYAEHDEVRQSVRRELGERMARGEE